MMASIKQNLFFLMFAAVTLNILGLSASAYYNIINSMPKKNDFEMIDCGDAAGRIHKCIRIDVKAGEVTDPVKGASYRVIYGH